jgi:oligopeptide transport system substrate-binding protein
MNLATGIESLDPAFAKALFMMWQCNQLYNRLVDNDASGKIVPSIATGWQVSQDRKTYTFKIRKGIYFHDNEAFINGKGRAVVASDVTYSLNRIISETVNSPGSWIFNGKVDSLQPFLAPNDSTFIIQLQQPFNPLLNILSMQYCSIVPHEVVDKWGKDFRSHPCGTGPFQFDYWDEGNILSLIKNKNYWEVDSTGNSLPYLKAIKTTFIDSKASEFLMFMQNKIDFMNGIDASFKDQLTTKKGVLKKEFEGKIQLLKKPYCNIEYLGILNDSKNSNANELLLQKKVRQALNMGFDKSKLVMYLRNSVGKPANVGMIPYGLVGFDSVQQNFSTYQPERAKQILKTIQQDKPITLLVPDMYEDRCTFIASQLADLGLKIKVEVIQQSLLREQISQNKVALFWATWIGDYLDAESYMAMFYSKNGSPPNYTRFSNQQFDQLYEQALVCKDDASKLLLYKQMDAIIREEVPAIPLFYDEVNHFLQPTIKGWQTNALNLVSLKSVKKATLD